MLKKIRFTAVVLALVAVAAPALAGERPDNLFQDGEDRQFYIVAADQATPLVASLDEANADVFTDKDGVQCATAAPRFRTDPSDSEEGYSPHFPTSN